MKNNQNPNPFTNQIRRCADILHAKGPRLITMRSHEMRDGTTMHATCAPCPVKDARGYAKASGERYRLTAGNISRNAYFYHSDPIHHSHHSYHSHYSHFPRRRAAGADTGTGAAVRAGSGTGTDAAESPVLSTVLLVAVTAVLCAAILVFCLGFFGGAFEDEQIPEILKITDVSHHSGGHLTYAGIVSLKNTGDSRLENKKYGAYLYVNEGARKAVIGTLYTHDFIPTHHRFVKLIGGLGPGGSYWDVGETGYFDFTDKLIKPGDVVRIDIFEQDSGKIISRSEYKAKEI